MSEPTMRQLRRWNRLLAGGLLEHQGVADEPSARLVIRLLRELTSGDHGVDRVLGQPPVVLGPAGRETASLGQIIGGDRDHRVTLAVGRTVVHGGQADIQTGRRCSGRRRGVK